MTSRCRGLPPLSPTRELTSIYSSGVDFGRGITTQMFKPELPQLSPISDEEDETESSSSWMPPSTSEQDVSFEWSDDEDDCEETDDDDLLVGLQFVDTEETEAQPKLLKRKAPSEDLLSTLWRESARALVHFSTSKMGNGNI